MSNSNQIDVWALNGAKTKPTAKYDQGWLAGEKPVNEHMNFLQNEFGAKVNFINRRGLADWVGTGAGVTATTYAEDDIVQVGGVIYRALRANTNRPPATSTDDWVPLLVTDPIPGQGVTWDENSRLRAAAYYMTGNTVDNTTGITGLVFKHSNGMLYTCTRNDRLRTTLGVYSTGQVDQLVGGVEGAKVDRAGDTMSGDLTARNLYVANGTDKIVGFTAAASPKIQFSSNLSSGNTMIGSGNSSSTGSVLIQPRGAGNATNQSNFDPRGVLTVGAYVLVSQLAQATQNNALTRRDFVMSQINTRAPTDHEHDADDITSGRLGVARIPPANNNSTVGTGFGGFRYTLSGNTLRLYTT